MQSLTWQKGSGQTTGWLRKQLSRSIFISPTTVTNGETDGEGVVKREGGRVLKHHLKYRIEVARYPVIFVTDCLLDPDIDVTSH